MHFLKAAWDAMGDMLKTANGFGVPIPVVLGALVLYFFMRRGMNWSVRQRYYIDLLKQLGIWRDTLDDRLDYYLEPGSQHQAGPEGEHFGGLTTKGYEAYSAFKDLQQTARIFLSEESIKALDHLVSEHWSIKQFETVSTADYLQRTMDEVKAAYEKLLVHAKSDFKRSQYLGIVKALRPDPK